MVIYLILHYIMYNITYSFLLNITYYEYIVLLMYSIYSVVYIQNSNVLNNNTFLLIYNTKKTIYIL